MNEDRAPQGNHPKEESFFHGKNKLFAAKI